MMTPTSSSNPIFAQAASAIARLSGHFIDNRWRGPDGAT